VPVGRLDYHTSGTLLFSNDGDFTLTLSHPRKRVPRVYVAKVRGIVGDAGLARFAESIDVEGRATQPATVRRLRTEGDKTWLEITLREGRNRQVHRLGDKAGHTVLRLVRVAQAGVTHEGLRPGQWRLLGTEELGRLKQQYGVPVRVHGSAPLLAGETKKGARAAQPYSRETKGGARDDARKRSSAQARGAARARGTAKTHGAAKARGAFKARGRP
jgi:23S rRNA pseudouridine2605 synthase